MGHSTRTVILLAGAFALANPANPDNAPAPSPEPVSLSYDLSRDMAAKTFIVDPKIADHQLYLIGQMEPIRRPLKDGCVNIERVRSGDARYQNNETREALTDIVQDMDEAGMLVGLNPEDRFCVDETLAVATNDCGLNKTGGMNTVFRREEGLAPIRAFYIAASSLENPQRATNSFTHEGAGHGYHYAIGFRSDVLKNLTERERVFLDFAGEAFALATPIRIRYKQGNMAAIEGLRSRWGSDPMVDAFLGSMDQRPDDYEAAMRAAITAYFDQDEVIRQAAEKMLEEIAETPAMQYSPNRAVETIIGHSGLDRNDRIMSLLGEMGEDGNFDDPAFWQGLFENTVTPEFLVEVRNAQETGIGERCVADEAIMADITEREFAELETERADISGP